MTLPKAGVQLVAQNFNQFISTLNQSNQSVQQFAQQSGTAMSQANQAFTSVNTNELVNGVDNIGSALRRQDGPINNFQIAMAGALLKVGSVVADKVTVADAGAQSMQGEMRSLVLQLGKELPVSTREVADAATELAKGGLTAATLQSGALRDTLNFATASQLGLAEASNLSIKQLGTFVEAGADAATQAKFIAESQDLLVKSANSSTVNVGELANGLLMAGGTAKAVGVQYQDFVGVMGAISGAFPSAAEAGTSYKNFLLRLQPTSEKAYEQMAKLGLVTGDTGKMLKLLSDIGIKPAGDDIATLTGQIAKYQSEVLGMKESEIQKFFQTELGTNQFYTATGELKSMSEVAQILQDATKDLTAEQRSLAFSTLFGNDAMTAAVKISELGASGLNAFQAQMAGAKGVTEMYEATMKGATAASTNYEGTIEALGISIGDNFLPYQEQAYNVGNQYATTLLNMSEALRGNQQAYDSLSAPAQQFLDFVKSLGQMWSIIDAGEKGNNITYALKTLSPTVAQLVPYVMNFKQGLRDLAPAFTPIVNAVIEFGTSVQNFVIGLFPIASEWFNWITGDTHNFGNALTSVLGFGIDIVVRFFQILSFTFDTLSNLIVFLRDVVHDNFNAINYTITTVQTVFATLVEVARFALALVTYAFTGNSEIITDAWNTMATRLGEIWSQWWTVAKQYLYDTGMSILTFFMDFAKSIPQMLLTMAFNAGQYVGTLRNNIVNGISAMWNYLKWSFTEAPFLLINALSAFPGKAEVWIKKTWTFMKDTIAKAFTWDEVGKGMTDGLIQSLWDNIGGVWEAFKKFGLKLIEAFNKGIESASPSRAMMRSGKSMTDGVALGLYQNQETVLSAVDDLARSVIVAFDKTASRSQPLTTNVYNQQSTAYNLGVTTSATASDVITNYQMMQVLT